MYEKIKCKGCDQTTTHIIDKVISTSPHHGERDVVGHCQECGETGRWCSWLIPNY